MDYCPRCGSHRIDQSEFCGTCGSAFSDVPPAKAQSPDSAQGEDTRVSSSIIGDHPVTHPLASQTEASGSESATTVSRGTRPWQIVTGLLVIGMIGLAFATVTTNQSLDGTRADLASTSSALASTQQNLSAESTSLAEAENDLSRLADEQANLQLQLGGREACIKAQQADQTELDRLYEMLRTNFNRSAKGSDLANADIAREKALSQGMEFYYQGFSRAYDGNFSSANASIDKGNAAIRSADAKLKIINAETKKIDAMSDLLSKDLDALAAQIANTIAICQGTNTAT